MSLNYTRDDCPRAGTVERMQQPREPLPMGRRPLSEGQARFALLMERMHQTTMEAAKRTTASGTMAPLTYGHMRSFWLVASREGRSVSAYAEMAGVSKSVMSRHLLDIGDYTRERAPGLGLVTSRRSLAVGLSTFEVYLTPKGRGLLENLRSLSQLWCQKETTGD